MKNNRRLFDISLGLAIGFGVPMTIQEHPGWALAILIWGLLIASLRAKIDAYFRRIETGKLLDGIADRFTIYRDDIRREMAKDLIGHRVNIVSPSGQIRDTAVVTDVNDTTVTYDHLSPDAAAGDFFVKHDNPDGTPKRRKRTAKEA